MIPFDQINAVALGQLPQLVTNWLPNGRMRGAEYVTGSLSDDKGESLSINTRTGKWSDFATGAKGGDAISLHAAIYNNGDRVASARTMGAILGVTTDTVDRAPPAAQPKADWLPGRPPEDAPAAPRGGWDHAYAYRDETGEPTHYILRRDATATDRKKIAPLSWGSLNGKLGWHQKHVATPRPLYGLEQLHNRSTVILCEGEKAADAARVMLPKAACVSWPGGTSAVALADWQALDGKRVIIWPDNDEPGHKAADEIRVILSGIASRIQLLDVSDLPEKGDAADLITDDPSGWVRDHLGSVIGGTHGRPVDPGTPSVQIARRSAGLDPIQVRAGEVDIAASLGEDALMRAGLPVYQRGIMLVRPAKREVAAANGRTTFAVGLAEIGSPALIDLMCQAVEWQKYDKRNDGWRQIDPPPQVAAVILSRCGCWKFPSVSGVISTPTLRPDGSVLDAPGYDPATRLYHCDDPFLQMNLLDPNKPNAVKALALIKGLLHGFPFVTGVDQSVAIAAIVTAVVRGAMPVSPLFAFRASTAGSGKSYLANLVSVISTGRPCPVASASTDEAETEKRLVGLLLAGYPILSLDNVNGELGGDLLCQATEQPLIGIRALGKSDIFEIENRCVIIATGNALRVRGDMTRRSLVSDLDAGMERPELREFDSDPVATVMADRGLYVAACLTIVRAYLASSEPVALSPLASYGEWSRTVRAALVWLGCEDPCLSMETARDDDPDLIELREFVGVWESTFGLKVSLTVKQIEDQTSRLFNGDLQHPEMRDVLIRIAGTPRGDVNSKRLGAWLRSKTGKIVGGRKIKNCGTASGGIARWGVV